MHAGRHGGRNQRGNLRRILASSAALSVLFGLAASAAERLDPPAPLPEGVTPQIEKAIERGLRYLIQHQQSDGEWGASPQKSDLFPVAVTGLVGLAFLAHGDTVTRGEHAEAVAKITEYLLSVQSQDEADKGLFTGGAESARGNRKGPRPMYGHAFAMTFLGQVYGQEGDLHRRERIRLALRDAISLTARAQSNDGGWAYAPNYWEDEGTLTVTQLQALRTCRDVGLLVPRSVVDRGVQFIVNSSEPEGWVRYRVQDREYRPGVTCAAVVALWNAGKYDMPELKRTMDWVNKRISFEWDGGYDHAEYVAYYLAQAKWIMGGKTWLEFYGPAAREFLRLQDADGHWEGVDESRYGSTFATAIALIILQLPYNRMPVYQR